MRISVFILLITFFSVLVLAGKIDIGVEAVVGSGADELFSKVWNKMEEMAPDYVELHSGTSSEYSLNFEVIFLVDDEGKSGVIWKENGKKIGSFTRSPDSPFPFRFFLIDAASVPLERAALLKLKNGDWGKFLRVTYRSSIEEYASFSPDSRYLVFSSDRNGGNRDIFMIDLKNGSMTSLRLSGSSEYFPSISPNGSTLLFQGSFTGNWGVYTIPIDGNIRKIRRLAGTRNAAAYMPSWVDEDHIVYLMDNSDGNEVYFEDITTKVSTKIDLPFKYIFSPRMCGGDLYFVGLKEADFGIYKLTKNGSILVVENSEYNEHDMDISSDCRSMIFVSNRDGVYRLWYKDLQTGEERVVTDFIDYDVFYPSFSPDGKVVVLSVYKPGIEPDVWLVRLDVHGKAEGFHNGETPVQEGTKDNIGSIGGD